MPNRTDIPIGRQNAIRRADLCRLWGCGDRLARRCISALRAQPSDNGFAILSSAHRPEGYWRSADTAELSAFIAENEARARSAFVAVCEARRLLERDGIIGVDLDALPTLPKRNGSGGW